MIGHRRTKPRIQIGRSGAVNLVAADGSGTLTTTPLATDAKSAIFTPDGSTALVVTTSNALERVDLASGAVTVLQTSSVLGVANVSNDGSFATYRASTDPMTGHGDLWLSDARNAGTSAVQAIGITGAPTPAAVAARTTRPFRPSG